jgi:phosphoribosylpyrophosphate synthetase
MVLVGNVKGRIAIIVDDMADTCGTLCKAADVVIENGATSAIAIVTHGILSGDAINKINNSQLKHLVVTNTVPHEEKKKLCDRIVTIDISPTVSQAQRSECHVLSTNSFISLQRPAVEPTTERACRSFSSTRLWIRNLRMPVNWTLAIV